MRLLFLSTVFPSPYRPTKGVFNLELLRALRPAHTVQVISPVPWVDAWQARRQGVAPRCAPRHRDLDGIAAYYPLYYYPPKILRRYYHHLLWWSVRGAVARSLRQAVPDAIIGYWAHPDGAVAVRLAKQLGVPAVVMVGGSDVLLVARSNRRGRVAQVLHDADAVITTSQDLQAKVAAFGVRPGKVFVVYRGVDTSKFHPGEREEARRRLGIPTAGNVLLWVGRMEPVKGLDVLLEACNRLRDRRLDYRLYLVGDGSLRRALENQAGQRGLAERVSFVGVRMHEQLPDWYRAADLTVLPSRSEGVPNVLRESLACGTPFLASRVGGVPEVSDSPSNRLVPPGDPEAFAGAIEQFLRDRPVPAAPVLGIGTAEAAEALLDVIRPLVVKHGGARPEADAASPTEMVAI